MTTNHDKFSAMAARIVGNEQNPFGGAFVVVPPENGGAALEVLILDATQDATQFWSILKTKCELALYELEEKQRNSAAFGGRVR